MNKLSILVLIFIAFGLAACNTAVLTAKPPQQPSVSPGTLPTNTPTAATATPTAMPTNTEPAPTELPASSGDPVWDRVRASGRIVFGTSADYAPFEYYDEEYEITGFDPVLARSLGERLDLEVEFADIAFEGLPGALQSGQIDAAIAAISVTSQRQTIMDFTNVYYSGQDAVLSRTGSQIEAIVAPAQLAQYRVGVQRGSIYAGWMEETLVDPGLMPEANLLRYAKASDAVRDLREGRNDLVVLDRLTADDYILKGGVIRVGGNLNQQLFAIALPKGSSVLQQELNAALIDLQNDGTIARLTDAFLDIQVPVITPTPLPTSTPIPWPTATPVPCYDGMQFVSDVVVPDGTIMSPGQDFDKIWRVRNTGTCTWNGQYRLVFVQGDRMDGATEVITTIVRPGETYDIIIDQKAPESPGKYTGIWQMVNQNKTPFGERVWIKITVAGAEKPTPIPPTATLVPPVQPTLEPGPDIHYLNASPETVQQGEVVALNWSFSGEKVWSAQLSRVNPDGSVTQIINGTNFPPRGQHEDRMDYPGTYAYTMNLNGRTGGIATKTVLVNVLAVNTGKELRQGEWQLVRLINPVKPEVELSPLGDSALTINFNAIGTIAGWTGCNRFTIPYRIPAGNEIVFAEGRLRLGQQVCNSAIMGQEALFLELLITAEQFKVSGNMLTLQVKHPDPGQDTWIPVLQFVRK